MKSTRTRVVSVVAATALAFAGLSTPGASAQEPGSSIDNVLESEAFKPFLIAFGYVTGGLLMSSSLFAPQCNLFDTRAC